MSVKTEHMWAIKMHKKHLSLFTVKRTRAEAIEAYDSLSEPFSKYTYAKMRRRGNAIAVRVLVTEAPPSTPTAKETP